MSTLSNATLKTKIQIVEEILLRTPRETIQKLYNVLEYTSTLEFLTMLALTSGKLLKVGCEHARIRS